MLHGLGARPVGVILVPGDDAAVVRRLVEELVVPEADSAVEELRGGKEERWVPEDSWNAGPVRHAPRAWKRTVSGLADSLEWYS